jgi:uncharacterized protein (UPF0262 family)
MAARDRIVAIEFDENTVIRRSPDVEHERKVAIFDLLEENNCRPVGPFDGPFRLKLGVEENRLALAFASEDGSPLRKIMLSLTPFRRVTRDYFAVCESYYNAIKSASPSQIEAIDMGRRGLHNEGSELLRERLAGKVELDLETARRLFTLLCVLQIRG